MSAADPSAKLDPEKYAQWLEERGHRHQAALVRQRARAEDFIRSVSTRSFPPAPAKPAHPTRLTEVSTPDYTVDAQAALLRKLLRHGTYGWDLYLGNDDMLSVDFEVMLTPEEAALARMVIGPEARNIPNKGV